MTISVVLADANILVSRTLRDYFLYAADNGAIEIRWSQQILTEMSAPFQLEGLFGQADAGAFGGGGDDAVMEDDADAFIPDGAESMDEDG